MSTDSPQNQPADRNAAAMKATNASMIRLWLTDLLVIPTILYLGYTYSLSAILPSPPGDVQLGHFIVMVVMIKAIKYLFRDRLNNRVTVDHLNVIAMNMRVISRQLDSLGYMAVMYMSDKPSDAVLNTNTQETKENTPNE